MTTPLPLFWRALDELPGAATDRRDWQRRLAEEFVLARRYLRKTGRRAVSIDCPSPGGAGCPRAVIRLSSGGLRAVCRSDEGQCDPVALTPDDLDVLELDLPRLGQDLAAAFAAQPTNPIAAPARILPLGAHGIAAGVSAPLILAVPGPRCPLTIDDLRLAGVGGERAALLLPTAASLPSPLRARLIADGHQVIALDDVTACTSGTGLALLQPVEVLLRAIRDALQERLSAKSAAPRVPLPPGTAWGQITLRVTSSATVICAAPGVSRQMDPGDFAMRSAKNAKATAAWTFFLLLATQGGILSIPGGTIPPRARKQKEALSRHLQETFGLSEDPIPWDARQRAYVAAFVLRDERPKREREQWLREAGGQRGR